MSRQLVITYYADRDMLGLVSDEDYEAFKDILLEQLHKEWPKASIASFFRASRKMVPSRTSNRACTRSRTT